MTIMSGGFGLWMLLESRQNAGKQAITALPTSSFFSSADSFAMIRGGHIDMAVLGAMEVSEGGGIANWTIPGKTVTGLGGAMDLVAGVKRLAVVMDHANKAGAPKILRDCTLPLTGRACVDLIITDLCAMASDKLGLRLVEQAPGVSLDEVLENTGACFTADRALERAA
ncbi:CoA-transferase [Novosphingobium sp. Rr 2-17]|uniref:CoA-transferase n=1 Tax=Novosphingobium sp. Rr 2-17 TaxID=555793 RepID=UPI0009FEFB39|nr:CoA-transferase [Novosphingobium sp. Rr 2-17]